MFRVLSAAAAAALFVAGSASAATVTLNSTIDLSKASIGNFMFVGSVLGETMALPLAPPFSVSEGDTFVWNGDFAGNTQLSATNLTFLTAQIGLTDPGQFTIANLTGQMELLSASGQVVFSVAKTYDDFAIAHAFAAFDFPGAVPVPAVTFAGFRYTVTVNDYWNPGATTLSYNGPSFGVGGQGPLLVSTFTVDDPGPPQSAAPEPAAWALMIGGFALAGGALRRRRAAFV